MTNKPKEGDTRVYTDSDRKYTIHEKFINNWWELHREDGPAYYEASGYEEYWIDGRNYSRDRWIARISKLGRLLYG
jgi:hypothetical protein